MKKLLNPKTGEVAYLNLENNTIYFSLSKSTHKAIISTNPETGAISKITATAEIISEAEVKPESSNKTISNPIEEPIETLNPNESCFEKDFVENDYPLPLFPEMEYFEETPLSFEPLEILDTVLGKYNTLSA